jgi:hypothetical protein
MKYYNAFTTWYADQYIHGCTRDGIEEFRLNGRTYSNLQTAKREATMTHIRFFFKWGAWGHNPALETPLQGRWKCARSLAAAEQWGKENHLSFEWGDDFRDGDEPDDVERVEYCTVFDREGNHLTSLGAIWDASPEYRRVIQAEMATEAKLVLEMM